MGTEFARTSFLRKKNDLTFPKQSPHLHQRSLLVKAFCILYKCWINVIHQNYSCWDIYRKRTAVWWQHRQFFGRHTVIPWLVQNGKLQCYKKALIPGQIRLGIRESGYCGFGCSNFSCRCFRMFQWLNLPIIDAAQYSALADWLLWCQKCSIVMPWLWASVVEIFTRYCSTLCYKSARKGITCTYECPTAEIQNKSALPLQIPLLVSIPHAWVIYIRHKVILRDKSNRN